MKILAPASSAAEAAALISAGAGELYCGLHPLAWKSRYGRETWVNRRGPGRANVESPGELKRLAGTAHDRGVPVYLALNMPFYSPGLQQELVSLAREAAAHCRVDALIIADPGLMAAVKKSLPGTVIHASSLAAVLNSAAALFFKEIGASRIIFPRYLDPAEMGLIIGRAGRELEYEAFILNDGCVFEEGYCQASHALGGAFCHLPWSYSLAGEGGGEGSGPGEPFSAHLRDYRRWTWFVRNCDGHPGPGGYPLGMCGLCALPEFRELGIKSLKIVGREAPLQKKIASVRLVRRILDLVEAGDSPGAVRSKARRMRGVPALCGSGYMCYYR